MTMLWFASILVFSVLINSIVSYECGVKDASSPEVWPWHVAVYHRDEKKASVSYKCAGTLISKTFVLTAGHCVSNKKPNVVFIIVGLQDSDYAKKLNVSKIHIYKTPVTTFPKRRNDIALLELATRVRFSRYIRPACVNQLEDLTNTTGTVIGRKFIKNDELPTLKTQQIPVVITNDCLESEHETFRFELDNSLFCAGYRNETVVCEGDSGGGIHFEQEGGDWYVGGLVAFSGSMTASGDVCIKGYAAFTNVYHFIPWIRNVTKLQLTQKAGTRTYDLARTLLPQYCGRYLVNRIFNGINAKMDEFPWMARLVRRNSTSEVRSRTCHGTIISKRYVLTSAWCVHEQRKPYQVELGEFDLSQDPDCNTYDLSDCAPPVKTVKIENITSHEEYDDYAPKHDIALIRLAEDVEFDDYIHPVCLPVTESLKQRKLREFIITGWGRTKKDGRFANVLQKATVFMVDQFRCRAEMVPRFYVGDRVICAGGNGTPNSCSWDNGGPLGYPVQVGENRQRFVQYGVTSANGCGEFISIYTDVTFYMDWILANLN